MSNLDFKQCENVQRKDDSELPSFTAQMATALNAGSCSTSKEDIKSNYEIGGGGIVMTASFAVAFAMGYNESSIDQSTSSMGCEQIQQIAKRNYDTREKIKCIINQQQSAITNLVEAVNSIKITSGKNVEILCPEEFNIDQKINLQITSSNQLSQEQKTEITNVLVENAKLNLKTASSSQFGFASTPQGQNVLIESIKKVEESDFKQQVSQDALDILCEVDAENNINLKAFEGVYITGNQCNITQDTLISIIAQTMINSVNGLAFKDFANKISEYTEERKLEASSIPTNQSKNYFDNKTILYIIGFIILIMMIGLIIYIINKKSSDENINNNLQLLKNNPL
jgi:hypothetical protein